MRILFAMLRFVLLLALLAALPAGILQAADEASSGFGNIAIPDPVRPATAQECVEPVEVMRRDHMKFLDHQRDVTVIDGERGSKYSLVGCMNCHNPPRADGEIVRYEDPQHFCAECHAYASVKIDCFECHADRGLENLEQSSLAPAWRGARSGLDAATLGLRTRGGDGD